jgi:hypothetical protein
MNCAEGCPDGLAPVDTTERIRMKISGIADSFEPLLSYGP